MDKVRAVLPAGLMERSPIASKHEGMNTGCGSDTLDTSGRRKAMGSPFNLVGGDPQPDAIAVRDTAIKILVVKPTSRFFEKNKRMSCYRSAKAYL